MCKHNLVSQFDIGTWYVILLFVSKSISKNNLYAYSLIYNININCLDIAV